MVRPRDSEGGRGASVPEENDVGDEGPLPLSRVDTHPEALRIVPVSRTCEATRRVVFWNRDDLIFYAATVDRPVQGCMNEEDGDDGGTAQRLAHCRCAHPR